MTSWFSAASVMVWPEQNRTCRESSCSLKCLVSPVANIDLFYSDWGCDCLVAVLHPHSRFTPAFLPLLSFLLCGDVAPQAPLSNLEGGQFGRDHRGGGKLT